VKAFGSVREVFETLTARGGGIALATECKGPELKHYLSLLDVDEFIRATACGDNVEHRKPDTRIVGVALRKPGLSGFRGNDGDMPLRSRGRIRSRHSGGWSADGRLFDRPAPRSGLLAIADEISRLLDALRDSKPSWPRSSRNVGTY
jgi:hypothetical protein